ncbi:caspase family protein, partial [Blastococcus tunisiensis]
MALRALLVGIDDYADPRNNLNSCLADVADLKSRLEQRYGFPADGIRTLQDAEATIQNVRTELDRLFQGATSDDRLVFMYSGHGFQMPENGSLTEVLVLRDGFFKDDELSDRARSVPPGILTVVLDSCFSGGMQKFFITGQGAEVVRGKVWAPDDSQAAAVNKALLEGALARMEPFGSAAITDSVAAAEEKGFVDTSDAAGKTKAAGDEQGQLQLNGLLMSACRENETASAKRSDTDGLSAFSFALREATSLLGSGGTPAQLHEQAGKRLEQMGFQQRPLLFDPPSAPGMSARSIFLGEGGASSTPAAGTTGGGDLSSVIADAIRRAMATMGKDKTMTAPTATAPATATPGAGDQADEKFVSALGSVLEGLIPMITPTIRELIGDGQQKSGGAGTAPAGEVDEKIWGALGSILSSVAVPLIQQV